MDRLAWYNDEWNLIIDKKGLADDGTILLLERPQWWKEDVWVRESLIKQFKEE